MNYLELVQQIKAKSSFLCVGLDIDLDKIPKHFLDFEDPIFEFNKGIIDATADLCVAYKPNLAFYECYGSKGWDAFQKTINYISDDHFIIADAKRGDIGNTSNRYAKAFFEHYKCDALTVAPYMGIDSVEPFMQEGKWVILLALTSNVGSQDFQFLTSDGRHLYEHVIEKSQAWGSHENLMFVVGATHPEQLSSIRKMVPQHFMLVPGVGAQGGSLKAVAEAAINKDIGLLVNSTRGIIYAGKDENYQRDVRQAALTLQQEMAQIMDSKGLS